jgi:DNA-binding transcriptional MocR family regulator
MHLSEVISKIRVYWHLISKRYQKIFLYLQWFNKTYIHTFPSLDTIAAANACSRRTVSRALAYFEENNWITRIKRAYQSNIYELHPDLLEFDCFDNNNFKKQAGAQSVPQNGPQFGPVLESSNLPISSTCTSAVPDIKSEEKATPKIHPCIYHLRLTTDQKVKLTHEFSEYHLANAIDDGKWFESKGKKIKELMGFLWSQARKSKNRLKSA